MVFFLTLGKYCKKVIHRMLSSLSLSSIHYGLSLTRELCFFREVMSFSISRSAEDLTKTCNVKCAGQSTLKKITRIYLIAVL